MRYDGERDETASNIVNNSAQYELIQIFQTFSQEKYAEKVAKAIIIERQKGKMHTTGDLKRAICKEFNLGEDNGSNPIIRRTFQALRIATNQEFLNLSAFLESVPRMIDRNGLFLALTFHSLEEKYLA